VITAVIPVSPIKSHPDISILTETVESIRHHLPDAELIITFDGVREEQSERKTDYEEAIRRTLWKADHQWGNVDPWIFEGHTHQVGMMRAVLDEIRTPLLLYVEQDTPLVTDEPIHWDAITEFILSGRSNCVRLHHEGVIPEPHLPMMHGNEDGFIRTSQFSARPHVATVAFYRRLLSEFSENANAFIEDKAHGIIDQAFKLDGMTGWNLWRLHIYAKDPTNLKRSLHLDGRGGGPKWAEKQVF
jgi:hypothetical protein